MARGGELEDERHGPKTAPANKLTAKERELVLEIVNEAARRDLTPNQIVPKLADEHRCVASESTMYRILREENLLKHRGIAKAPVRRPPNEHVAIGPKQVWSWDITKLLGPVKWTYFYLYVVLDTFSRYLVGWMLARSERAELARRLVRESCLRHGVAAGELSLHMDRGAPMRSKTLAQTLADLGVEASFSQPPISNDNPFSEAHFKTLKYRPGFPDCFASFESAQNLCARLFAWYNDGHRHAGLVGLTPAQVHFGHALKVLARREEIMRVAYERHPERFLRGAPGVAKLPAAVWITPPVRREEHVIETPKESDDGVDLSRGHPLNRVQRVSHAR